MKAQTMAVLAMVLGACGYDAPCPGFDGTCETVGVTMAPSDGTDPATFCDDENPCTEDYNCTACEDVQAAGERPDIFHCGGWRDPSLGDPLPPACTGRTGCFHVNITDDASVGCFATIDGALGVGQCCAGTCIASTDTCT